MINNPLSVAELLKNFSELKLITPDCDLNKAITLPEISRPGLALCGFCQYFPENRIQLFGLQEIKYLESINYDPKQIAHFFNSNIPLIIITRNQKVSDIFLDLANKYHIAVVISEEITSKIQSKLFVYLEERLALSKQIHAECLNVFGTGILIIGNSGIGKSELALELINRGHFLIADDSVILRFVDKNHIIATAPPIIKNRLEIRGLGIIDITKLYGVTKVLEKTNIKLIIEIQNYTGNEERLGLNILYKDIEGYKIPKIVIPITPGRNLANLVETAVANYNLRENYDYDAAKIFQEDLLDMLKD